MVDLNQLSDEQLNQAVTGLQAQEAPTQAPPSVSNIQLDALSEEQLNQAVAEEQARVAQELAPIPEIPEASLGVTQRLAFSTEPLLANREAALIQQFGEGNVFKDEAGDLAFCKTVK